MESARLLKAQNAVFLHLESYDLMQLAKDSEIDYSTDKHELDVYEFEVGELNSYPQTD